MFEVRFTSEAKAAIQAISQREGYARPGLMVHRQGPAADLSRAQDGGAAWSIQRRHAWRAQVGDFGSFQTDTDIHLFDEIHVWLALVPKPHERGVMVSLLEGDLHVEPLDA